MKNANPKTEKSVVAITRGGRWEAKKVVQKGLDLIGGINSVVKKGDTVLLKPNMGYPEPPGMPPWTCLTDVVVLVALTELFLEAGAKRVITGDGCAHGIKGAYMFNASGYKQEIEKAGGEVSYFDEEPLQIREVPGGVLLKKQAIPKVVLDADVIINVPKIKTGGGGWTLGFKNMLGLIPQEERGPWHRTPELLYLLTDLQRLVKPSLTIMDGFVIKEGPGSTRFGDPIDFGAIIIGKDPVATEAVAVLVIGHEIYEQPVLLIAEKYALGTSDLNRIEVRGESIESVRRYTRGGPSAHSWIHPSPNVVEYIGGCCQGCGLMIRYTLSPWEIDKNKKYALIVGNTPRLPERFTEDEVIVFGSCALKSKAKILKACPEGVTPQFLGGCPPWGEQTLPGHFKFHGIDKLPHSPCWSGSKTT